MNATHPAQNISGCFYINATNHVGYTSTFGPLEVSILLYVPCDVGTFTPSGTNQQQSCMLCPLGSFMKETGASQCDACAATVPRTLSLGANSTSACLSCPLGSYCPIGSLPVLCPAGGYESLANDLLLDSRDGCENLPCLDGWWCGPGAAEGSTYGRILSFSPVLSTVLLRSTRTVTWGITNVDLMKPVRMYPTASSAFISGLQATDGSSVQAGFDIPPASTTYLQVTLDATSLDPSHPVVAGNMTFAWHDDSLSSNFTLTVPTQIQLTSVVVTPQSFTYQIALGDTALNPTPLVNIFNTLCNNSISYQVIAGCEGANATTTTPDWFDYGFDTSTVHVIAAERGLPDSLPFGFNFTTAPVDSDGKATLLKYCFNVQVQMNGLDLNASFPVNITVQVKTPCPPGSTSSTGDNTQGCALCSSGQYQPKAGQTTCLVCDATLPTTLSTGSTSASDCTTLPGTYVNNGTAIPCPAAADCTVATGLTLVTLPLRPGFWRTGPHSGDFRQCPSQFAQYCKGGAFSPGSSRRALASIESAMGALCIPHHVGPYCATCEASYVKRGADHVCQSCEGVGSQDSARIAGILSGIVAALLLCIAWYFCHVWFARIPPGELMKRPILSKMVRFDRFIVSKLDWVAYADKLKILVGLFQVIGSMSLLFADVLPSFFQELARVFSIFALDLVTLFDFGCSLPEQNHFTSLLISTLIPIGVVALTVVVHSSAQKWIIKENAALSRSISTAAWTFTLIFLFFVYPSVSAKVLRTFPCDYLDDGSASLVADHSVNCATSEYASFRAYAIFMSLVYPLGVPVLFLGLLLWRRQKLHPRVLDAELQVENMSFLKRFFAVLSRALRRTQMSTSDVVSAQLREQDESILYLQFLFKSYKPAFYWFEVAELIRKLAQTSLIVFFDPGSSQQIITQLFITAFFVSLVGWLQPYREAADNFLALLALWVIFGISFTSLLIRLDVTTHAFDKDFLFTIQIALFFLAPAVALAQVIQDTASGGCCSRSQKLPVKSGVLNSAGDLDESDFRSETNLGRGNEAFSKLRDENAVLREKVRRLQGELEQRGGLPQSQLLQSRSPHTGQVVVSETV
jgi:hypothetical protein